MYYEKKLSHVCGSMRELEPMWVRKVLKISYVTFQNLVHNSCNTRHVTQLHMDHTPKIESDDDD
jgi:hypothetical protein